MSVKAISWAFEAEVGDRIAKLVLLALADHANEQYECWPGAELVAKKAEVHRATVFRAVNYLVSNGFIRREARTHSHGGSRTPLYLLNVENQNQSIVAACDRGVSHSSDRGCRTAATTVEPPLEPSIVNILKEEELSLNAFGEAGERKKPSGKQKPCHGQRTKDGKRIWFDVKTSEWIAHANDYREARNGLEPLLQWNESGSWFNAFGEIAA